MPGAKVNLLIADDEPFIRKAFSEIFTARDRQDQADGAKRQSRTLPPSRQENRNGMQSEAIDTFEALRESPSSGGCNVENSYKNHGPRRLRLSCGVAGIPSTYCWPARSPNSSGREISFYGVKHDEPGSSHP